MFLFAVFCGFFGTASTVMLLHNWRRCCYRRHLWVFDNELPERIINVFKRWGSKALKAAGIWRRPSFEVKGETGKTFSFCSRKKRNAILKSQLYFNLFESCTITCKKRRNIFHCRKVLKVNFCCRYMKVVRMLWNANNCILYLTLLLTLFFFFFFTLHMHAKILQQINICTH